MVRMGANADLRALLRACKDEPDDDAPRLVLADWLEEHGDEERARYIRVQVRDQSNVLDPRPPVPAWLGQWGDWAGEAGSTPGGYQYDRASFLRGLLHISSQERFPAELGRLLTPPFDWTWVGSLSGACWSSTADFTPLLRSAQVHELSSLSIMGDGRIKDLAEQFASSQPLPNLTALDLSDVDLTDHGLVTLCRTPLPRLRSLGLDKNRITAKGVRVIADHPQFSRLRQLDLSMNPIGNGGAKLLADGWYRSTLRRLDLAGCHIEDSGMLRLASEEQLPNLERLFLYGNRITDRGVKALRDLPRRRLLTIALGRNPRISSACQDELRRAFGESLWLTIGGNEVPA